MDESVIKTLQPFVEFSTEANVVAVHRTITNYEGFKPLFAFPPYNEISNYEKVDSCRQMSLTEIIKHIAQSDKIDTYHELVVELSRINAFTPHSSYVERCISANNRFKTAMRNNFSLQTEINYLYVHINMPSLLTKKL